MSETTTEATAPEETPAEQPVTDAPEAAVVPVPDVVAQESKVVGDDELPEPREVQISVNQEQVPAQVSQPREGDAEKVNVHEVFVTTDEVITDPASPLAVQVPDAGRSPLLNGGLPIATLAEGHVEQRFDSSDES